MQEIWGFKVHEEAPKTHSWEVWVTHTELSQQFCYFGHSFKTSEPHAARILHAKEEKAAS